MLGKFYDELFCGWIRAVLSWSILMSIEPKGECESPASWFSLAPLSSEEKIYHPCASLYTRLTCHIKSGNQNVGHHHSCCLHNLRCQSPPKPRLKTWCIMPSSQSPTPRFMNPLRSNDDHDNNLVVYTNAAPYEYLIPISTSTTSTFMIALVAAMYTSRKKT